RQEARGFFCTLFFTRVEPWQYIERDGWRAVVGKPSVPSQAALPGDSGIAVQQIEASSLARRDL
ncbi:MAG: hypothetical protein ACTH8C_09710, partial [Pseudomonas taetrolens]|uniref:hypothetical protein n=1 Tax=Pseudomonas taetrolens TaxID=47884 RepID=UPI003F983C46